MLSDALKRNKLSGDGFYSRKCQEWFEEALGCSKALLTPSGTHSLEMAAILLDIREEDEVIMPSYTFVSTANAFVLRGATIVFVDIRPDTMNVDETLIEAAITDRTKAIVPMHYAGVSCDMDAISALAGKHGLAVVEDAAQGVMSFYKGRPLGSIGEIGTLSFHETKNLTSGGEGGLTILNDHRLAERAEIIREKGTNRSQFLRGQLVKYSWIDLGSSYLMNEISAAYLWAQIGKARDIFDARMRIYQTYREALAQLETEGRLELPVVPDGTAHNAHMFYLKTRDLAERTRFIDYLKTRDIVAPFHYVPLHSSDAGLSFGRFSGQDRHTTRESERLVRLPVFYNLTSGEQASVIDAVHDFYARKDA